MRSEKVDLTGAISSIGSDALKDRPLTNATNALAGLASGLSVSNSGGNTPGFESQSILVRGRGTLNNSAPLVVVDGMTGIALSDINPQDIENISVLKDAASSAIYGSRAANGVILVTTRRGLKNLRESHTAATYRSKPWQNASTSSPTMPISWRSERRTHCQRTSTPLLSGEDRRMAQRCRTQPHHLSQHRLAGPYLQKSLGGTEPQSICHGRIEICQIQHIAGLRQQPRHDILHRLQALSAPHQP